MSVNELIFKFLIFLRVIFPPIIFTFLHPFVAMLIDEVVLDGIVSPHHFFNDVIPENIKGRHKIKYDIFLDTWGFTNGLLPVLYKGNKFYRVFENHRMLILTLFAWKITGYILVYIFKNYKFNLVFQNFFIAVYLSVSFCDFFQIKKNHGKIMALFIVIFILREFYLSTLNEKL